MSFNSAPPRTKAHPFITKLYTALDESDRGVIDRDVISWTDCGRAFAVFDIDRFMNEVAVRFWSFRSFKSFKRQLHLYSFHVVPSGPLKGCFMHEAFLRGHVEILPFIERFGCKKARESKGLTGPVQVPNNMTLHSMKATDFQTMTVSPTSCTAAPMAGPPPMSMPTSMSMTMEPQPLGAPPLMAQPSCDEETMIMDDAELAAVVLGEGDWLAELLDPEAIPCPSQTPAYSCDQAMNELELPPSPIGLCRGLTSLEGGFPAMQQQASIDFDDMFD